MRTLQILHVREVGADVCARIHGHELAHRDETVSLRIGCRTAILCARISATRAERPLTGIT